MVSGELALAACHDTPLFSRRRRADGTWEVVPGLLWAGSGGVSGEIQQCPEFEGKSNFPGDPFTGYNYNTSYIGRGAAELEKTPARLHAERLDLRRGQVP